MRIGRIELWAMLAVLSAVSPAIAEEKGSTKRVQAVRVTVLSTMLADTKGVGEWGFSALVEADGHKLLFDTGARPGTVLANARELGVDLSNVSDVVLSHHHGDHTGGLLTLRREWSKIDPKALAVAHVGPGIFLSRPGADGSETNETIAFKSTYESTGGRFVSIDRPTELFPGAWLTGPIPRTHPERNWSGRGKVLTSEGAVEDTIPEDISLVLDTEPGLVVVTGCGHAGLVNILEFARARIRPSAPIYAVVGGVHLFSADATLLDWTAEKLRPMHISHLLGAHCTGIETVYSLRSRLGLDRQHCVVGAVGAGFDLDKGINAGTIAR